MGNTSKKYSAEVRDRAVRLFQEHVHEHPSRWAAMQSIAEKIGCTTQTLSDWVRRAEAAADLIARDLDISTAEATVAAMLVTGRNVKDIAARASVSQHTVRCQLKSIFAKTGTRSQPDLIRRIALGPAVIRELQSFGTRPL